VELQDQNQSPQSFWNWKNAAGTMEALLHLANCHSHKQVQIAWVQYKISTKQGTTFPGRMIGL